jgi:hypothetical protein
VKAPVKGYEGQRHLTPTELADIDKSLTGPMRSCGNYVITPGLMDRMFAADTSGICNNDPIMNWTDEEVQRWGLARSTTTSSSSAEPAAVMPAK